MKKYTSLFIVLFMVFGLSIIKVTAEDQVELNDVRQVKPIVVDDNGNPIPPKSTLFKMEKRLNDSEKELLKKEQEDKKSELKDGRDGLKKEIEQKREEMKKEFEKKMEDLKQQYEQKKQEMEKTREEGKAKLEALREDAKLEKDAEKSKIKEDRITGRMKAFERFTQMEANIADFKDRISTNILKVEEKDVITIKAKAFIVTAETALTGIKAKITEANILLAGSTNQLTIEAKTSLVKLTQELQTLIKTAYQALNDANKSLKDAVKVKIEADKTAANAITPTTTTETNN